MHSHAKLTVGTSHCHRFTRCHQMMWKPLNLHSWVCLKNGVLANSLFLFKIMMRMTREHMRGWIWRGSQLENWFRKPLNLVICVFPCLFVRKLRLPYNFKHHLRNILIGSHFVSSGTWIHTLLSYPSIFLSPEF